MSYAVESYDDYGAESEYIQSCIESRLEWVDRQFNVHTIKRMETSHIRNCIAGIENGKQYYAQEWKLDLLKDELKRRADAKHAQVEASHAELLAAAKEVVKWWYSGAGQNVSGMIDRLRAAIAKAEGEVTP